MFFSGAENEPRDIHPHQGLSLYGEDATENRRNRRFSEFWYDSQSLCPFGVSHGFYYRATPSALSQMKTSYLPVISGKDLKYL